MYIKEMSSESPNKWADVHLTYDDIRDISNGLYYLVSSDHPEAKKYEKIQSKCAFIFDMVKHGMVQPEIIVKMYGAYGIVPNNGAGSMFKALENLKPCPSCGGKDLNACIIAGKWRVGCVAQDCMGYISHMKGLDELEQAVEAWNQLERKND